MATLRRELPPPTGASNAGEVGRNHDSEPIYGFTACVLWTVPAASAIHLCDGR